MSRNRQLVFFPHHSNWYNVPTLQNGTQHCCPSNELASVDVFEVFLGEHKVAFLVHFTTDSIQQLTTWLNSKGFVFSYQGHLGKEKSQVNIPLLFLFITWVHQVALEVKPPRFLTCSTLPRSCWIPPNGWLAPWCWATAFLKLLGIASHRGKQEHLRFRKGKGMVFIPYPP